MWAIFDPGNVGFGFRDVNFAVLGWDTCNAWKENLGFLLMLGGYLPILVPGSKSQTGGTRSDFGNPKIGIRT
jgi:hypothetical protein